MKRIAIFSILIALTTTAGATQNDSNRLSPQKAAAAFFIGRFIETDAPGYTSAFYATALRYQQHLRRFADQSGGTRADFPATIVRCDFGGEVEISGNNGPLYVLTASFRNCATRLFGIEYRATGPMEVKLINLPFISQRPVSITMGRQGVDFVEERYFEDHLDYLAARSTINSRVIGDFFERDELGNPLYGSFDLLIDGLFQDEGFYVNTDNEPIVHTFTIDANKILTSGSTRLITKYVQGEPQQANAFITQFHSGVLTSDIFAPGDTPPFVRKEWAFDNFKIEVITGFVSGTTHSLSGSVEVNLPETANDNCPAGKLKFSTHTRINETYAGSQQFTSGFMTINNATIRFADEDPFVRIRAPGYDPVDAFDILALGNCSY